MLRLSGLAALSVVLAHSAMAGDWTLTESTAISLTNVDRTGNNPYSGNVLQLSPNIVLDGKGARVTGTVSVKPTFSVGSGSTDPRFLTNEGFARGRMEVVEDVFFLGANAGARLYGNSGIAGGVDAINVNSDGGQSYSAALQPEFRFRPNRYVEVVSNNSIDYVTYSSQDENQGEDSSSVRLHLGVRNGRGFGPLSWRADASTETTRFDDRDDERQSYTAGIGYRLDNTWAVNGDVGYEDNDVQTSRSDTSGATWNVGVNWRPNPRNSASFSYGDRYFGETYSGRYAHQSRRTSLSVELSREIDNQRNQQLVDNFFFLVDPSGNPVVDPGTGAPIIVNIPQVQQIDEDFVNERLRAAISVTGRRTTISLSGSVYQREYEVSGREEDGYDVSLSLSRSLGSNLRATLGGRYEKVESSTQGDSDFYDVRVSLSRSLGRRTNASIELSHRERDAESSIDSYTEDRIGFTLTTSFL
jgi:uncharacterized protein (PEP-CTERM system associated)